MTKYFEVSAIQIPIVYNKYGDVDPDGLMYVLKDNEPKVQEAVKKCPGTYVNLVQPLVIRVNQFDTFEIAFTNKLCFSTGINIKGLNCEIQTSDGAFVGANDSSLAAPGKTVVYRWEATTQGGFQLSDLGNPLSSELGSNVHGLFGAVIVEPMGSTWTDPQTGEKLKSGVFADIHHPFLPDFREYVTIFHDEAPVKNRCLETAFDPHSGAAAMTHSINYRSEPMRNRLHLIEQGIVCPECIGEEVHHDSWVFGDPPPTILPRAYVGDPIHWYAIGGGMQETHIFHLHLQQWNSDTQDPGSNLIDSIHLSPGQTAAFHVLYGAGSLQKAYGDVIYHCHLYPHFEEGMWGLHRIHNVFEDGTRCYPDGTPITKLMPLPDRPEPPKPTDDIPGFPFFIPGTVGNRAPVPPRGWNRELPITELEKKALVPNAELGALFVNPCPKEAPIRRYDIVGIQRKLIYNEECWNDPEGRLYVLAKDEDAVMNGTKRPEPLFIHANAGECIEIHFTNRFPEQLGPNPFQLLTETLFASTHVHLVKFDVQSSDGANSGWNYFTGASFNQTVVFRWYADVELRACFFHDHLFPNAVQLHGLFAALIVEPEGSCFFDSHTGDKTEVGSQIAVENPFLPNFREFNLAVADFIPAVDKNGKALNPPVQLGTMDDFGIMGFNYASAPLKFRKGDSAYALSSYVHGDPCTPIFEGYVGDPVRVRLLDGSHEESHAINFNRYSWRTQTRNMNSRRTNENHIGISEAFTFEFCLDGTDGEDKNKDFDVLYYSGGRDDFWLGTWGITRVRGTRIPGLYTLNDRKKLPQRTDPLPYKTGEPPEMAISKKPNVPVGTKIREFHVAAIHSDIIYNKFGDHDPFGMTYVEYDDVPKILSGEMNPKPLIITINAGELLELKLTNLLPKNLDVPFFPEVPVQDKWPNSSRVSMHSQMAVYNVLDSDGTTVGFNPNQTIGVDDTFTYYWFYEESAQQAILVDFADTINHRHHGLFGALNLAPVGSTTLFNNMKEIACTGDQLTITNPFLPSYRQFSILAQNGIYLLDKDENLLPKMFFEPLVTPFDFDNEDQGMKGFNLRSEPFFNRLKANEKVSELFRSIEENKNDPLTPVFLAKVDDPIVVKFFVPAGSPRPIPLFVHNQLSHNEPTNMDSQINGVYGAVTIGGSRNLQLINQDKFIKTEPGDYMYQSTSIRWDIEQGMWGFMRILPKDSDKIISINR